MSELSSSQPIHQSEPPMYLSQTVSQSMSSNSNYYILSNQEVHNSPQYLRMSSTSEDEIDSFTPQDHPWQVVKGVKTEKIEAIKKPLPHHRSTHRQAHPQHQHKKKGETVHGATTSTTKKSAKHSYAVKNAKNTCAWNMSLCVAAETE
ncbi:hypothetical protein FQA39_LY01236 [Lamprigera yunnana]|nr:hypothetical protein FQA39_LY01236 [Lamprigera yunnana]